MTLFSLEDTSDIAPGYRKNHSKLTVNLMSSSVWTQMAFYNISTLSRMRKTAQ